jgi:hypothetical protein
MQRALWNDKEQDGFASYWKTSRREERGGKKLKKKDCGNEEQIQDFVYQPI